MAGIMAVMPTPIPKMLINAATRLRTGTKEESIRLKSAIINKTPEIAAMMHAMRKPFF
jgi:hypothetical protein